MSFKLNNPSILVDEIRETYNPNSNETLPYIGLEHINQNSLTINGVGKSSDTQSSKRKFKKGDILFGTLRPYFRKVVTLDFDGVCSTDIAVLRPKSLADSYYAKYFIANKQFIDFAYANSNGTRMPRANWKQLSKSNWLLPNEQIKFKIGCVLSSYDNLIQINTTRINILEEIAQRIYKEWFVNFKYPGHENYNLVDSELGMIPQDWKILDYDSITKIISRGPSIKYVNEDSGIPVINQKCVRNGEIELDAIKYGSPLNTNKKYCYLQINDILINSMGVGTLGRISRNLSINSKMIIHNCITFVRADESKVKQSFLYYSLKKNQLYFEQLGIGSTGQTSLKIDIIKRKKVIVPKQKLLTEFDKLVDPIWKEIGLLKNKNHNLQQTRDHLLPKLISGKVDISDLNIDTSILDD